MDPIETLTLLDNLTGTLAFFTIIVKSFINNIQDYRKTNHWNWTRTLIILIFSMNFLKKIFRLLYFSFGLPHEEWIITQEITEMSVASTFSGFMVAFGLTFVFYLNNLDYLLYGPLAFYGMTVNYYVTTGVEAFHIYFMYIGGAITIITIYQAGFSLKDNDALGLGITYTFIFAAAVLQDPIINPIINLLAWGFIFLLAFEKFQPYKEKGGTR